MEFETIKYMEWAKLKSWARINLSRSGIEDLSLQSLKLDLSELDISGDQAYGYPPLIEALAARYRVKEDNVVTTVGASQAIFFVCAALLEQGDEVLIEKPAYEPLLAVPRIFRARLIRLERRFEERYKIDLDRFQSCLSENIKLVILTNLHNPSGALLARAEIQKLAALAQKKGAWIFIDEIYLEFLEGEESQSAFKLAENVIVASSLTKVYGLGGLRCGWILAPAPLAERLRKLMDYLIVEQVFIGEQISAKIFPRLDLLKAKNMPMIERNKALVKKFIQGERKLSWVEPAQGIICFPRLEISFSGDDLARILREEHETSVVPGSFFEEPQHFRLGFGVQTQALAQGLENIRKAVNKI